MVLLLHQEGRKRNAHVERTRPVGITVLQALLLGLLISQALVGLADHDELGTGLGVILVPIGVVEQCQFPIGLLDLLNGGIIFDFEYLVGVEALHILLGTDDDGGALYDAVCNGRQQQDLHRGRSTLSTNLKVM